MHVKNVSLISASLISLQERRSEIKKKTTNFIFTVNWYRIRCVSCSQSNCYEPIDSFRIVSKSYFPSVASTSALRKQTTMLHVRLRMVLIVVLGQACVRGYNKDEGIVFQLSNIKYRRQSGRSLYSHVVSFSGDESTSEDKYYSEGNGKGSDVVDSEDTSQSVTTSPSHSYHYPSPVAGKGKGKGSKSSKTSKKDSKSDKSDSSSTSEGKPSPKPIPAPMSDSPTEPPSGSAPSNDMRKLASER
jgi:hypothetical protein